MELEKDQFRFARLEEEGRNDKKSKAPQLVSRPVEQNHLIAVTQVREKSDSSMSAEKRKSGNGGGGGGGGFFSTMLRGGGNSNNNEQR